ncbi:MAG: phosphoribosylaminoimidazolesuccinocarboxamide synthase [Kiritimatiellia bacterium]|nr:phosphoribosylaminoimidazolesuccinocarboxamide synthase [Lentisphaerota bacterium]
MINEARLRQELAQTMDTTDFPGLGDKTTGKVRDSYRADGRLILITTDRISAFDRVLGTIPFKGQVLNQMADFWFNATRDLVPNHVLTVPDPNVMVVRECRQLALEFVVRNYLTGVTKTSLWYNYERGVREYCGHKLPERLRKDQRLERPILTPTTKFEKHDRPVSREQAIAEKLIEPELFDAAAEICMRLFDFGVRHALQRGLILVDTKYELGLCDGQLLISDEIHTPDSSRYWFADSYDELFSAGADQRKIDKEYVREWFVQQGFRGDGVPPAMPDDVRLEAARRYINAYELISGREFSATDQAPQQRIENNLRQAGLLS